MFIEKSSLQKIFEDFWKPLELLEKVSYSLPFTDEAVGYRYHSHKYHHDQNNNEQMFRLRMLGSINTNDSQGKNDNAKDLEQK